MREKVRVLATDQEKVSVVCVKRERLSERECV